MPQTPSSFFSMLKRVQASMHSQLRKDENIYCCQFQGHSTHFTVDFRREAEGSGAGRQDCGPRGSLCTLARTGGGPRPPQGLARSHLAHEGIPLGVVDGVHGQVDVQVRPVKMMGTRTCDVHQLTYRDIAKPRKVFEGEKDLSGVNEEPETVSGYVGDLNVRSVLPTRHGFHPRAPE